MASNLVRNFLGERRRRAVATVMRYVESEVYPLLKPAQQQELRRQIMAAIGDYHDSAVDIVKASVNDDTVVNEEAIVMLTRIEGGLADLRRASGDG